MSKGGSTAERVRQIAEPIAEQLGLEIWDIRFLKEGADWFLRIFIDKEGGVDINDCENMSRALDGPLDEQDPIPQSYCLEVSSPGLERELANEEHLKKSVGKKIKVKLIRPVEGKRELGGILQSSDGRDFTICLDDGSAFTINLKETGYVKLDEIE